MWTRNFSPASRRLASCLCLSAAVLAFSTATKAAMYLTIDVPGASDTFPQAINEMGVVTGSYCAGTCGGFVRMPDGTIGTFSAGTGSTAALAINSDGAVTGEYGDIGENVDGYVRTPDGQITTFKIGDRQTVGQAINSRGTIAGYTRDAAGIYHGLLRKASGKTISFDGPEADFGTFATSINNFGLIAGYYSVAGLTHGFLRSVDGTLASFDVTDSTSTTPNSINAHGAIAGYAYVNGADVGFVRDAAGAVTTFSAPADVGGTSALAINDKGVVTGIVVVKYKHTRTARGFLRSPAGTIHEFDAPGSIAPGTIASGLNDQKWVVGYYSGADRHTHGFLRMP
jgi:hypothetical protein